MPQLNKGISHQQTQAVTVQKRIIHYCETAAISIIGVNLRFSQGGVMRANYKLTLLNMVNEAADPKKFLAKLREEGDQSVQDEVAIVMKQFGEYCAREYNFTTLYVVKNAKEMTPSVWWSMNDKVVPNCSCKIA
eukprot:6199300-Pleurochrysis_carterae.AAC.1